MDLACDSCSATITAGEPGSVDLTVRNVGEVDDSYRLAVENLPEGWSATIAPEEVAVPAGAERAATVTIDAPRRTKAGSYSLTVSATSIGDPQVSDSEQIAVEAGKRRDAQARGG